MIALPMGLGNLGAERRGIEELAPSRDDDVLVVGYGVGTGVRLLSRSLRNGKITGIDASETMASVATMVNAKDIASGKVTLRFGTVASAPWPEQAFDGALAVNNIQLWEPRTASLAAIYRMLRPGARFVASSHAFTVAPLEERAAYLASLSEDLEHVGFVEVSTDRRGSGMGEELWVFGRRPE